MQMILCKGKNPLFPVNLTPSRQIWMVVGVGWLVCVCMCVCVCVCVCAHARAQCVCEVELYCVIVEGLKLVPFI